MDTEYMYFKKKQYITLGLTHIRCLLMFGTPLCLFCPKGKFIMYFQINPNIHMQSRDEFIGETLASVETLVEKSKKKKDQNGEDADEQLDNEEDNSVDLDESTMPVLLPRTPGKRKAAAMMATQGM